MMRSSAGLFVVDDDDDVVEVNRLCGNDASFRRTKPNRHAELQLFSTWL